MSQTKEYFILALRNLKTRPLRSWLTILGIVIGIFLIVSLVSIAQGVVKSVEDQLKSIGGDVIMVMPGKGYDIATLLGGIQLENRDIEAIKRARGVESVFEVPFTTELVRHHDESEYLLLWGINFDEGIPFLRDLLGWEIEEGNFPRIGRREVIVGNLVPKEIFPGLMPGDEIVISGRRFTVSGVLTSLGNRQDDMTTVLDLSDYRNTTSHKEGTQMAFVSAKEGFNVETVVGNIEWELEDSVKRVKGEASFSVYSSDAITGVVGNIMLILQFAVFVFASIAAFVGAIGIMNSMFTSVRERTREIGIMKAVGAKNSAVLSIFLIEAGVIGLIGGVIGTVLGVGLAKLGELFLRDAHPVLYIEAHISASLIISVLLFSLILGCLAGYFPAKKAAKLRPVEALRHHE